MNGSAQTPAPAQGPLSISRLETLLKGQVPSVRITGLVREQHVEFQMTPELEQEFRSLGATDEVLKALRDNYLIDPAAVERWKQGQADFNSQNWDNGARDYRAAIELSPDFADAHLGLAQVLNRQGSDRDALEEYRKAEKLNPAGFSPHAEASEILWRHQCWKDVSEEARQWVSLDSNSAMAHAALARALYKLGRLDETLLEYQKAAKLDPSNPRFNDNAKSVAAEIQRQNGVASAPASEAACESPDKWPSAVITATSGSTPQPSADSNHAAPLGGVPGGVPGGSMGRVTGGETGAPPLPRSKPVAGKRITVGGQVEEAKKIYAPPPEYPQVARMARVQGVVRMAALIGKDGTIRELHLISGPPLLVNAAMQAVSKWRYQPTLLNGEPVYVDTEIDVNFTLTEK